jgi:mannan endo-1,4-beta-mannosidase
VQNWGWYDPAGQAASFERACRKATKYLDRHWRISRRLGKPFVLEEFGLARDDGSFDPQHPVHRRNAYFELLLTRLVKLSRDHQASIAANVWAWAGSGQPRLPGCFWKPGDPPTGDPPFEPQGWYSIYASDLSTLNLLQQFNQALDQ